MTDRERHKCVPAHSLWSSPGVLESGGLECELILMGRWGSALAGLPGTWLKIPMLSAEVTGVDWCSQGLEVFCIAHAHTNKQTEGHNALKATHTSLSTSHSTQTVHKNCLSLIMWYFPTHSQMLIMNDVKKWFQLSYIILQYSGLTDMQEVFRATTVLFSV